ncbi:MAG: VWA domain-containing protein [Dehalococcoidia bacterium]|nr:VWA domain-containing protein [Dehalococcoidia bacterium]
MPVWNTRSRWLGAALAAALALAVGGGASAEPAIEVDATVASDGSLTARVAVSGAVPGAAAPELLLDGQPVAAALAVSAPASVVIAVETSASMGDGRLATAQAAARAVIDALPPGAQVAVVAFENDPIVLAPLAGDRTAARAARLDSCTCRTGRARRCVAPNAMGKARTSTTTGTTQTPCTGRSAGLARPAVCARAGVPCADPRARARRRRAVGRS